MKTSQPSGDEIISSIQANVVPPRPPKVLDYGSSEWCQFVDAQNDDQKAEISRLRAACRFRRRLIWALITALICILVHYLCDDGGILIFITLLGIPFLASVLSTNDFFSDRV